MTSLARAARSRQQQPCMTGLGSATWYRLARMAAAGILAAGTGVLTAALLVPAAASASSSQTWTGGGDGTSWSDGLNWASNSAPQNGDSVTIPAVNFPARTVVTGMPAGTQLQDLTMTDASLSGGDVTVAGNFSWSVSQGFEVLGSPLTVAGDASIGGAGEAESQDPMTFDGTAEFNGPGLLSIQDSGPAITNNGTLTVAPNAVVWASTCCVNPDVLLNTGTVGMTSPGTGNLAGMEFNDQGSVVVAPGSLLDITGGGTLQFEQGATMTLASNLQIQSGTTVALSLGTFSGPGNLTGSGNFSWSGGTINGNLDVGNTITTTISGTNTKTLTSPSSTPTALTLHGATSQAGSGELELSGTTTLSNLGTLTLNTGTTIGAGV